MFSFLRRQPIRKSRRVTHRVQQDRCPEGSLIDSLEARVMLAGTNPNELVDTSLTPAQLAQSLVGAGVSVSHVTFTGGSSSTGAFAFADPKVIGFGQGILLSSGNAADVVGPNTSDYNSTDWTLAGDADLTTLSGYTTYDASVLEFDFVPTANQVVFNYVFSSDEYPEWVNTPFNDVFGFYVNGTNYATVRQVAGDPNSPFVPVAVNNINNGNPQYYPDFIPMRPDLFRPNYVDPSGGPSLIDLEMDGLTSVLTFQAPVTPGVVNHMKLAIADASDGIYDSAVFIQAGSLVSNQNPVADLSLSTSTVAPNAPVTAIIEAEDPNGLPLTYTIDWGDGTTSNGALNQPANKNEKTALVNHTYIASGNYLVKLTVSNGALSGTSTEDLEVTGTQAGAPVITKQPTSQSAFDSAQFTFTASATGSPTPTVQWQVSSDGGATFVNIPGATSGNYTATATLSKNDYLYQAVFTNSEGSATTSAATLTVMNESFAPVITLNPTDQIASPGDTFSFTASANGFPAPTVQWQVSTDGGATFVGIPGATSKNYTATATLSKDGYLYQAVFTNSEGSATTSAATLTITTSDVPPVVTADPTDQTVYEGDTFTFTASATGVPVPTVQWQVSTDGGATFVDIPGATSGNYTATATLSKNGYLYQAVFTNNDEDSAVSAAALLTVLPVPTAPGVALTQDTGEFADDRITSVGTLTLSDIEEGAVVEYSVDQGVTWTGSFQAVEGLNQLQVRQTDTWGRISDPSSFSFTLDTVHPKAPRASLARDTGTSDSDNLTRDGTLDLSAIETGARVEYSIDHGHSWNDHFTAAEGLNTVLVRQTDLAGNVSEPTEDIFTLDTVAPAAPGVGLSQDTGASPSDNLTRDGALKLSGVEENAIVEYSTDKGATWSKTFIAAEGENTVLVRQTDGAGNAGASASFSFVLDTKAPDAPGVALSQDTGSSSSDHITKIGNLSLSGLENGALAEYSTDNGATWNQTFTAVEGSNTVLVRQTDLAGNASDTATETFILDTTPPRLAPTFSSPQPFLVNATGIVAYPNATDQYGIGSQSAGAIDTFTPGQKFVTSTATDIAGNTASVQTAYIVGYRLVNVTPVAGSTCKHTGPIPVTFQLADANGLISDSAASDLLSSITVDLDGLDSSGVKYKKQSNSFSANLKAGKALAGSYTVSIHIRINGVEVTTAVIPINVVG